jgi:tRNA (cmo5U34)-methyltransferase
VAARDSAIHDSLQAGRWDFNDEVTRVFDDMLERSIPQYQTMRAAVHAVGDGFVRDDTTIVDLGCARGEALAAFAEDYHGRCRLVGCEVSTPMRQAAIDRFRETSGVAIYDTDLRVGYPVRTPPADVSLTLAVLTLQFVPINYRQRVLENAFRTTIDGGAIILVEKVLGASADVDALMVDVYHRSKRDAGYSREEVERKQLALEGVLVPVTADWNVELLRAAGFRQVDCFWRWMNFAAWVAIR